MFLFQAYNNLRQTKSDVEMFDKVVDIIGYIRRYDTPFTQDDLKIAGYLLFKKLAAAVIYDPTKKIKAPVTLIKASEKPLLLLGEDYGLSDVRVLLSLSLSLLFLPPFYYR